MPAGKIGDFALPMRGIVLPDTVEVNDTLRAPFAVGDGYDACSYVGTVWHSYYNVVYFVSWGLRHPGATCRETSVAFRVPPATVSRLEIPADLRTRKPFVHSRAVFCQPDGSFIVKEVVVRLWVPPEDRRTANADSVGKFDATMCRRLVPASP